MDNKVKLLALINNTADDTKYGVNLYTSKPNFTSEIKTKKEVQHIIENAKVIIKDGTIKGFRYYIFDDFCKIEEGAFYKNQLYVTENTDGYEKIIDKYNPYDYVYFKISDEDKTISFKLGKKEKTLKLIERSEFVSKPYKDTLLTSSVENLRKHIQDTFWNPRMVFIGRQILRIKQ